MPVAHYHTTAGLKGFFFFKALNWTGCHPSHSDQYSLTMVLGWLQCCFCCYCIFRYDSAHLGKVQAWWISSWTSEAQDRQQHARATQIRRSTFAVITLKLTTCHCQLISAKKNGAGCHFVVSFFTQAGRKEESNDTITLGSLFFCMFVAYKWSIINIYSFLIIPEYHGNGGVHGGRFLLYRFFL